MTFDDVLKLRKFGSMMHKTCQIDLEILKDKDPGNLMLEEANIFYELYLVDSFGSMIDIPILIRNYQTGTEGNVQTPNAEGTEPVSTWKLVRRFFVLDSISGVEESQPMSKPKFIRYASSITLKVMMDKEAQETIYRPLLIVDYNEVEIVKFKSDAQFKIQFESEYFSDYDWIFTQIQIACIVFNVVAFLVFVVRFRMYTKRNPRDVLGADATIMYFSKFIFYLCDVWGEFMFWLIFWSCGTIFMRYKLQENAT